MRVPAPEDRPVALTVAGSDAGGGAGVQADLQSMAAHGAFGTSVVTAVTAQNTRGVESTHVLPHEEVAAQYDAVVEDFDVDAVKTGMLATAPIVETVTDRVAETDAPAVIDPVMVAASGDPLLAPEAEAAYEDLIAAATLVTPNADEAEVLTDVDLDDATDAAAAGEDLVAMGADAALVKGGHLGGETVADVLVTTEGTTTFEHPRVDTDATHGSGCALASAIAARLAAGEDLHDAVAAGTAFLERAVRYHYDVGQGPGAVNHLTDLRDRGEREPTAEAVQSVVDRLVDAGIGPLVPDAGTTVVGATPHAETVADTAAVEGRLTRTLSGVRPTGGVRFEASGHVARCLLSAREADPDLRFACDVRFDDAIEAALDDLGWPVAEFDREDRSAESAAGTAMVPGADAFETAAGTPTAVVDRGAFATVPTTLLVAPDPATLTDRVLALASERDDRSAE